ncbi:MAG: methyltransferase [Pseudomonadota bacterium]
MRALPRFRAFKHRLLASPRFQRAAAAFWPTRWIARRSARRLFDLIGGFVASQVLAAVLELDLLQRVQRGAVSVEQLARDSEIAIDRFRVLIDAARVVGLLDVDDDDTVSLGELGAMLIGNPSLPEMIRHHAVFYRDLADPVALLRQPERDTELGKFWPYAAGGPDNDFDVGAADDYTALMAATQPMVSDEILRSFNFRRVRHVMDVGGGNGAFLRALNAKHPRLSLSLVDLPPVCSLARQAFDDAGLIDAVRLCPADFLRDALPRGADMITLVRIVHDHDDDAIRALFARIHAALPDEGRLLIAEPMLATPSAPMFGGVYFSLYLLAMGSGRPRRPDEIVEMLTNTGFRDCEWRRTAVPMVAQVLVASK